jgi:hypothetical protein
VKRFGICCFSLLSALVACVPTDLNVPCVLVKGSPDGGPAVNILKDDPVIRNSANKDFISFGSTECEDQVCVRDAAYNQDGMFTDGFAHGYCSRACVAGSSVGCPSQDGSLDSKPETKLSCRPLLLDEATLNAIKMADPARYQQTFGMTTSPYFCARSPVIIDAGM